MADAPLTGWQSLETAPDGQRVLLGPRYAPVVGIVRKMPRWADEQDPVASVTHYNGAVLVERYHCREWHPLPDGAAAQTQPQPAQPLTGASMTPFNRETQDQIASVMLQHGTPEQQAKALEYAAAITAPSTPTPPEVAP